MIWVKTNPCLVTNANVLIQDLIHVLPRKFLRSPGTITIRLIHWEISQVKETAVTKLLQWKNLS